MDLTHILEATVSQSTVDIQQAEKILDQLAEQNICALLKGLATELASVNKSVVARTAAGLRLKNYLTSKDPDLKLQCQQRWLTFASNDRQEIKTLVMQALGTEMSKPMAAPQCVAYIASAELPSDLWPELIQTLAVNVTNPHSSVALKVASLNSIGYICEEINSVILANQSNQILTAIVQGMRKEEQSIDVRLAATKALYNSLEFTKANFDKESERHFIMQVVCEATQCPEKMVVVAALENLVKIMSLYYQYMEAYMGPALFAITLESMKSSEDDIALQAIEFWSTVCDEEQDLAIEAAEAMESGRPPAQNSYHYARGALQFLVPILLLTLAKQEEFDDEDDWNPCKAAGVCISLMANSTDDAIIPHVIPFVKEHLDNLDWRFRDAAVMALGSIMEGPDPDQLAPHVADVVGKVIALMGNDPSVQVKDSAAWTIGRICEQVPVAVLQNEILVHLLQALIVGLNREPRVASNVCWAFSSLAEAAHDHALSTSVTDTVETYPLSSSFETIVTKIFNATERGDSAQSNLRTSAYEALMDLIKFSAKDCYVVVQRTTVHILEKLQKIVELDDAQLQGSDRQQIADLESLLCATLQSLIRKMSEADVIQVSDTVMQTLLLMLSTTSGQIGGVQEDAILTIGVLVEALNGGFIKYMEHVHPYLKVALKNYSDIQVCQAAIGLVGDLSRGISDQLIGYCDDIMQIMIDTLSYDLDMVDYVNELREGCLEGYTGIIQGLKGGTEEVSADVQLVMPHVPWILTFIESIGNDSDKSDGNISSAAGLLGDLLASFGIQLIPLINQKPAIHKLLMEGRQSRNRRTKTLSTWVTRTIKGLQTGESGGSKCG